MFDDSSTLDTQTGGASAQPASEPQQAVLHHLDQPDAQDSGTDQLPPIKWKKLAVAELKKVSTAMACEATQMLCTASLVGLATMLELLSEGPPAMSPSCCSHTDPVPTTGSCESPGMSPVHRRHFWLSCIRYHPCSAIKAVLCLAVGRKAADAKQAATEGTGEAGNGQAQPAPEA